MAPFGRRRGLKENELKYSLKKTTNIQLKGFNSFFFFGFWSLKINLGVFDINLCFSFKTQADIYKI